MSSLRVLAALSPGSALSLFARVVALVGVALVCPLSGCAGDDGCDLDGYTRDQGGFGLIDCGIASSDTSAVDACAVMALRQGGTFRALYESDDGGLEAIVRTSDAVYLQISTGADGATIEQIECGAGAFSQEGGRSFVSCLDPGESVVVCE